MDAKRRVVESAERHWLVLAHPHNPEIRLCARASCDPGTITMMRHGRHGPHGATSFEPRLRASTIRRCRLCPDPSMVRPTSTASTAWHRASGPRPIWPRQPRGSDHQTRPLTGLDQLQRLVHRAGRDRERFLERALDVALTSFDTGSHGALFDRCRRSGSPISAARNPRSSSHVTQLTGIVPDQPCDPGTAPSGN
jgi:hypothetical protein